MENNEVVQLYLDDIIPNRFQPREVFDDQALKELAISIREHGVIQPILVRKFGEKYEIIAGERRYKASTMAGLTKIPAIVKNLDDKESSKVALIENLQRRDLTPIEEARTYQKILDLDEMTQEQLAMTMGKSQSAVSNKLRLLSLPDEIQEALLKEEISERHARSLLNVEDKNVQIDLLKEIVANKMTVRELDSRIKKLNGNDSDSSTSDVTGGTTNEVMIEKEQPKSDEFLFGNEENKNSLFTIPEEKKEEATEAIPDKSFDNPFANLDAIKTEVLEKAEEKVVMEESKKESVSNDNSGEVDLRELALAADRLIAERSKNDSELLGDSLPSLDKKEGPIESKESESLFASKAVSDSSLDFGSMTASLFEKKEEETKADSLFSTPSVENIKEESTSLFGNNNQNETTGDNVLAVNNIRTAVNDVRNVVTSYKEKGYSVSIEELDLDNEVQLIIKFNKN